MFVLFFVFSSSDPCKKCSTLLQRGRRFILFSIVKRFAEMVFPHV